VTYTAVTIGPIYDAISLTSSPAGLWAASYLFSHISRRLCELIVERKLADDEKDILSPYFSASEKTIDGIGRYHDRIVFKPANEQNVLDEVNGLFDQVAEEVAEAFDGNPAQWFRQYLQLHAVCFPVAEDGNPILECTQYLDAIELEMTFPIGVGANPLENLLDSDKNERNIQIRNQIRGSFSDGKWPFPLYRNENGDERMPDMEDITGRRKETEAIEKAKKDGSPIPKRRKIKSYYAIVRSDGDRIGEYIKDCKMRGESEREFSKKCLDYCSASADLVKAYGGVPIFAGGDDLLFIAPLTGTVGEKDGTILELLAALRRIFDDSFRSKEGDPTISFGAAIRYFKYPLYEAFDETYKTLFHKAKKNRNAAAISMQKHSGQDIEFVLEDFKNSKITEKLQRLMARHIDEDVLKSIRDKLWEFQPLFINAVDIGAAAIKNVFDNTFDSEEHGAKHGDIDAARELLETIEAEGGKLRLEMLDSLLRFAKFWGEKGDDGDA
jgi:CRISPR-associated protein Cmr2